MIKCLASFGFLFREEKHPELLQKKQKRLLIKLRMFSTFNVYLFLVDYL